MLENLWDPYHSIGFEMNAILDNKIEEITDGFLVVIMAAMTNNSLGLKENYVKDQHFLDMVSALALHKRATLRKKLLKEVKKISEEIVEEINELTTCSKH